MYWWKPRFGITLLNFSTSETENTGNRNVKKQTHAEGQPRRARLVARKQAEQPAVDHNVWRGKYQLKHFFLDSAKSAIPWWNWNTPLSGARKLEKSAHTIIVLPKMICFGKIKLENIKRKQICRYEWVTEDGLVILHILCQVSLIWKDSNKIFIIISNAIIFHDENKAGRRVFLPMEELYS